MMTLKNTVKVLDCTIRDGGYINNWRFDKDLVRDVYRAVSKSGIDYFEIGFRGTEKYFDREKFGIWRFSSEEDIAETCNGIHGPKLSIMADFGKIDADDFLHRDESIISLVRLAAHKDKMGAALDFLQKVKEKGYETSLQAMGYSNYSDDEKRELLKMLGDADIDFIYVADSYGSIYPDQIRGMIEPFMELKTGVEVGFHPHNSLQMAFANTIEAIKCGVHIVDSSIYGMGRGAGNLPTEIILAYLQKMIPDKFNTIPVLDCIDRFFISMQKEFGWGYQLSYMLSGYFDCHPTYSQKLVDLREYTVEDIWRAFNLIKKKNPVGFSQELLSEIINMGITGESLASPGIKDNEEMPVSAGILHKTDVPYVNRHEGRTFLILANGPNLKNYSEQIHAFIDKYNPVVMGSNYLGGLFVPHYHAFSNKRRFESYINSVSPESVLMIGEHIPEEMIAEYTGREHETIYYIDSLKNDFDIINGVIQCNCRTISVLLIGVAVAMGADRIFAAGMDGYLMDSNNEVLFYDEKESKKDKDLIMDMHRWNSKFISQINEYFIHLGKEGIHILTPTSYTKFYKGINNYI